MVAITVKLYGVLVPPGTLSGSPWEVEVEAPDGESVRGVVHRLGINEGRIRLTFVGKERVGMDHVLKDGDTLNLFPPMAGG